MIDSKQLNLGALEQQNGLPSGLLQAVMHAESAGNPNAVSPKGAQGLFQFMPQTAKAYGINPLDPQQAAVGAARMYGDLSKQFGGDVPSMLAAYNWGSGNLTRKGIQNAPQETRDYIAKIQGDLGQNGQLVNQFTPTSNQASIDPVDAEIAALEAELGGQSADPVDAEIAALEAELAQKPSTFLGEMGENFVGGIQAAGDLFRGDYQDIGRTSPTPRTEALAGKLFPDGSDGSLLSAFGNIGNTAPSDWSGALLEKFGETPEGKGLAALGGIIPSFNAVGTAINRYVNPAIQDATGIAPENLQLLEMGAAPLGFKKAGSAKTPEVTLAKNIIKGGKKATETAVEGAKARTPEQLMERQASLNEEVANLYKTVDDEGAVIGSKKLAELVPTIEAEVAKKPFIAQLNPKTLSVVNAIKEAAKNGTLKLTDLDQYRRLLSNIKDEDGVSASAARTGIDSFIDSIEQRHLSGGSAKAKSALLEARATTAKAKSFEKVSDIIIKADGDANKIKAGLARFVSNKKNLRGFTKEEITALKNAARSTGGEKVLKTLGKFGFDLGSSTSTGNAVAPVVGTIFGATGGPLTAGAVPIIGTAARYGHKLSARGKAEKALKSIESRPIKNTPPVAAEEAAFRSRYGQSELGRTLAPDAQTPLQQFAKKFK